MLLCPKCGKEPLPGCFGRGIIPTGEEIARVCPNLLLSQMFNHLGEDIAISRRVSESPLYTDGSIDKTASNLFIKSQSWRDLCSHLKLTLGRKGLGFKFAIITDERIKAVFVGGEAYKARPVGERDDAEVNNTLSDLVSPWDLLIIRIGHLGYKNQAAAGALLEVLMIREHLKLPVWVVETATRPWASSHSFSQENNNYMQSAGYEYIEIRGSQEDDLLSPVDGISLDSGDSVEIASAPEPVLIPPSPPRQPEQGGGSTPQEFSDDNSFGLGPSPSAKKKWKKRF